MPRLSPDEKLAVIEKRLSGNKAEQLKLKRELRAVRSRQKKHTQKERAHAAIVLGLGMAEHATRNPSSEVRRVAIRLLEHHLTQRPDDPPVAALLELLRGAPSPAPDAEKLGADDPLQNEAESISDAAE